MICAAWDKTQVKILDPVDRLLDRILSLCNANIWSE
jgi:hypothetical protein